MAVSPTSLRDTSRASNGDVARKPTSSEPALPPSPRSPPPLTRRQSEKPSEPDPRPPTTRQRTRSTPAEPTPTPPERAKSPVEPESGKTDADDKDSSEEIIEMEVLNQILEMDDDPDDREFSKSIIWNYFEQAATTFDDMDRAITTRDLKQLSELGHFLKGSSAALGVRKVQASCEDMQHYGKQYDVRNKKDLTEKEAFDKIVALLKTLKVDYAEAEVWLKNYFDEP